MPNLTLSPALQQRLDLLKATTTDKVKTALDTAFTTAGGDWAATRQALADAKAPADQVAKLDLAHSLADVTGNNLSAVKTIAALPDVASLRDLALNYDAKTLAQIVTPEMLPAIDQAAADKTAADKVAPAATATDKTVTLVGEAQGFATTVMNKVFKLEPSAVVSRMVTTGDIPIADANIKAGVKTLLNNLTDFQIGNTSVYTAINDQNAFTGIDTQNQAAVVEQLKNISRVRSLVSTTDAMATLSAAGVVSAQQVASKSKQNFVKAFEGVLGTAQAKSIYDTATDIHTRNVRALQNMSDAVKGTGVAFIDGSSTVDSRMAMFKKAATDKQVQIDWENLFGPVDLCECGDCTSVYSPASYYVELLQYLRNDDLNPNNKFSNGTYKNSLAGTPLSYFFSRRPDLECLELTCANTNTILPYIDLANEVMESFVVHLDNLKITDTGKEIDTKDVIDAWNTEDETTSQLLAQPQHTNYDAYCILKSAVYPLALPYHQPIDEIRIFLTFLGTSRYELLKTFATTPSIDNSTGKPMPLQTPGTAANPNLALLEQLNSVALKRAADAEYLGLTQEQYIILTKEAYWQKQYFDILGGTILTTTDYQKNIGVRDVCDYYGYKTDAEMLSPNATSPTARGGLMFVKDQFLPSTGILYTDLINILLTQYINPGYPSGKALSIMDSISFSYRYLQTMVDNSSKDPKIKYAKLIAFLQTAEPLAAAIMAKLNPNPCSANNHDNYIDPKDLEKWVLCNFEKIGKLIVLDSGIGPYFPIEGSLYNRKDEISEGKPVGTLNTDGSVVDSNNKIIGQVNDRSVIVFNAPLTNLNGTFLEIYDGPILIGLSTPDGVVRYSSGDRDNGLYVKWQPALDTCDISKVTLLHLDGTHMTADEYDKMQRFIRLWQSQGMSIDETDKLITGLGCYKTGVGPGDGSGIGATTGGGNIFSGFRDNCNCNPDTGYDCGCCSSNPTDNGYYYDITCDLLHQLAEVNKLINITGLELIKQLTFWTDISIVGDPSLYETLFLTANMVGIDPVFEADANGNYLTAGGKITDHIPVIMAAFNIQATDVNTIMAFANIPDVLNLQNISNIYRNSLMMRILQLKSYELQQVWQLFGDPFTDAATSYHFMEIWGKMENAGFTFRQLNYIFNGFDDAKKPLAPSLKSMLILAKTLYDGLTQIDQANSDLTNPDQATAAFVQTEAALLYTSDVTAQIMGLLLGTTVYTAPVPANLVTTQASFTTLVTNAVTATPAAKGLLTKLSYNFSTGSIQVTGILTAAENTTAVSLFNSPDWAKSFAYIAQLSKNLYQDVLQAIFPPVAAGQPDPAAAMLLQGDSNIPDAQQDPNNIIPDTAPQKLLYFITAFLPYLRTQLENKLIIDTIASQSGMDIDATSILLQEILTDGTTVAPIIETFRSIKNQPAVATPWSGFLIPVVEDTYIFAFTFNPIVAALPATLTLNQKSVNFTQQAYPNDNTWLSDPVKLKTGHAYPVTITGISADLHELSWKTPITPKVAIPGSVLFPNDSVQTVQQAYAGVHKASVLVTGFTLPANELSYLQNNGADFDGLDFNAIKLKQWKHLYGYCQLRNSLPVTNTDLISFFTWVKQATDATQLSAQIAGLTLWAQSDIDKLLAADHYNLGLTDFKNEKKLLKLQNALYVVGQISMDINLLFTWAEPATKFWDCQAIARSIRITTKARYKETDWEQVVAPLNNQLRDHQRDALVAYLLVQPQLIDWGVVDADSLFEFFLIDVQMDACMQTSRIKQAINSIQLFVQRVFLGLEEIYGLPTTALDATRWVWMQDEVLWVANRKVFLYPENWLDESLRDDCSDFFTEFQSELLQKDINTQNVEDALKNYLYKLDEVANMSMVGIFEDGPNSKTHVFARTRNAPFMFYWRYYATDSSTWSAWEKIQVDIPSYDVLDGSGTPGKTIGNGCYLIPVVFKNRLLIFFPQISPKTVESSNNPIDVNTKDGDSKISAPSAPTTYWEIKMAWSEYRNGKWTQKQVSKDVVNSSQAKDTIDNYKFIPFIYGDHILIGIDDSADTDTSLLGGFFFEGSKIFVSPVPSLPSATNPNSELTFSFQKVNTGGQSSDQQVLELRTWQVDGASNSWIDTNYLTVEKAKDVSQSITNNNPEFYHPYTHELLNNVETGNLVDFFECVPNLQSPGDSISNLPIGGMPNNDIDEMFGRYFINNTSGSGSIYDEMTAPYSLYNWELFFHVPITLAGSLSKAQSFDTARDWFHYVFNPTAPGTDENRAWRFWPFQQSNAKNYLETLFSGLLPNTPDDADGQINQWRDHPYSPFVIARERPSAFMKWTVMKYLDNIIAWGDYLFTQHTIESINQATQLYVLASHILGNRPEVIPQRGTIKPETYKSLMNKWDAFGNAVVEMELVFPYNNQIDVAVEKYDDGSSIGFANIYGFATSLYFCIPDNPNLDNYWDVVTDRLYKIRHCENIEGVFGLPPLWDPPIDPGLLVQAEAAGISIASVLNDMSTPLPNYRFNYLMQKSLELCNELKTMGNSLLSAMEKQDAETLASMRARHENVMNGLVMQVKTEQLNEANAALDGLQQNRLGPAYRLQHFMSLIANTGAVPDENTDYTQIPDVNETPVADSGLILTSFEEEEMSKASEAQDWQLGVGITETLASIFHVIPTAEIKGHPFGVGVSSMIFAGTMLGNAAQAVARGLQIKVSDLTFQSTSAGKKGGFLRQLQERILQANNAGYELKQIDKQIATQNIRIAIANQEISNQQQMMDSSQEVLDFLTNKYTNEQLYVWMGNSIKSLYYQVYTLAYALAKKAEMVYRYDRGLASSNFIQFGYWNDAYDGLLAGEHLYVGLKQLETAYQQDKGYDFEITKTISLRQINPLALLQFRQTGQCEFELPEVLFDMDFPGHYMRKVRSVAMSVPCIVGPYTGINATLRMLSNRFRLDPSPKKKVDYEQAPDASFSIANTPVTSIAVSNAQNDSGVFELNFKDERYMPFEGAGVISTWSLTLPSGFRQFNYESITDVIIHLRYTSCDGGDSLGTAAAGSVTDYINSVANLSQTEGLFSVFDVKHDFPNEWYKGTQIPVPAGTSTRTFNLANLAERLPIFTKGFKTVSPTDIFIMTTADLQPGVFDLNTDGSDNSSFTLGAAIGKYKVFQVNGLSGSNKISNWILTITDTTTVLNDMWLVARYTLTKT